MKKIGTLIQQHTARLVQLEKERDTALLRLPDQFGLSMSDLINALVKLKGRDDFKPSPEPATTRTAADVSLGTVSATSVKQRKARVTVTPQMEKQVLKLKGQKKTAREISEEIGIAIPTVYLILRRNGK